MDSIFLKVLNMSTGACYVIAAVLAARLLLRRAPKIYSYLLWAVVGFRLCCPFSFRSVFSLFSVKPLQSTLSAGYGVANPVFFPDVYDTLEQVAAGTESLELSGVLVMNPSLTVGGGNSAVIPPEGTMSVSTGSILDMVVLIWFTGMAALLIYGLISYLCLYRKLRRAVRLKDNVWQSDWVKSPFILGIIRPKIYIPFSLSEEAFSYVLTHEHIHLRRKDHLIKILACFVLTVHWFNPLVWLAFRLLVKDMEMSCDERVLKELDKGSGAEKKEYSMSLLAFASNQRFYAPGPLAFGESAVKSRVKNVLRWKKPQQWMTVCALVFCLVVTAACAANPPEWPEEETLLGVSGVTVTGRDDGLTVSAEEEAGYSALENLKVRCEMQEWMDVDQAVREGLTLVEKLDSQPLESAEAYHGYYSLSNLLLVDGLPGAYAGAAIRPIDGQEVMHFTLQQDLNEETPIGARLTVKLEAVVNAPDAAAVTGCTILMERSSQETYRYGNRTILDASYEELHISEAALEDVALRIYNYIPLYAEMNG